MKKILIITTISGFLSKFGIENVKILKEKGYEVHYASNFHYPVYDIDYEMWKELGIILHHIDIRKSPLKIYENAKALCQLRKIMKKEQIQVVHCHNPLGGVIGRIAAKSTAKSIYVIYTAHGFHFYKGAPLKNWLFFYPVERFLARFTDCLITINEEDYHLAKKFRLRKGGSVEKISGIGLDLTIFYPQKERKEQVRKDLGIPEDAFHIVSVGELNKNKNHAIILKAMANMSDREKQNTYYTICGAGPNEENLKEMIKKLQLEHHVCLLGYRTDIPNILQSADCFAFPSVREGFGMAALEAMGCAIPVIASDNRGTREYMKHGQNGFVCNATCMQDFINAIRIFMMEKELRQKMSENALRTAKKFKKETTNIIMRQIYETAGKNGRE